MYRMNEIVKMIRKNGEATLILDGQTVTIGFADSGKPGTLTMLGGGYYTVRMTDGRRFSIAKGELINLA